MAKVTLVISINASWNIINFRTGLLGALRDAGYRVVALAPRDEHSARFAALGVEYVPIEIEREGRSPLRDMNLLWRYYRALRRLKPDLLLAYTIKPNIYGSLAARALRIPVINNVSGLGTAFIAQGPLTRIVRRLYKAALGRSATIFFQNRDDRDLFVADGLVEARQARLLPGSGIDLDRFRPAAYLPAYAGACTFLMIARLVWDKGVGEYIEAARRVRAQCPEARFQILGFMDMSKRTAVTPPEVEGWVAEGLIEYLGQTEDVRNFIAAADCVVLPSYREGLPRTLLEAAAMAKPVITTDVPGCRDVVDEGVTGFLCAVRDAASLAAAMMKMARLSPKERRVLGTAGRAKVEAQFDEKIVIERYFAAIDHALASRG